MDQISEQSRLDDIERRLEEAQAKTWEAVHAIAQKMTIGMSELEARRIGQSTLAQMGSRKFWHKCHIRFGSQTARSFDDPYDDVRLQDGDLFYIDIGPIWNDIEGDAGRTFATPSASADKIKCRDDSKMIFEECRKAWQSEQLTGQQLYAFAKQCAEQKGWILAPSYVQGHRLSEFPHSFHTKLNVAGLDFTPKAMRWVLEIQICDPSLQFGAFYEDVLS